MIVTVYENLADHRLNDVRERIERQGLRTRVFRNGRQTFIRCVGASTADGTLTACDPAVEHVSDASPFPLAVRLAVDDRTVVRVGADRDTAFGGKGIVMIAGPCAVEGRDVLLETARGVRAHGAGLLRGGVFKPRTSPYAYQGMGVPGLELLAQARSETGMPVVTEVMDPRMVQRVAEAADVLQVGARNMQNYPLLDELGRVPRPVLLKRGLAATITELLLAAERVLAAGNPNVILCERGIRTYETATRNTLDVGAVAVLRDMTHLPVIVDPSHAAGRRELVAPLALAAVAAGADGLIVEVHPQPDNAVSDGRQSLDLSGFADLMRGVRAVALAVGRSVGVDRQSVAQEVAA